jgi:hypothetical protein
MLWGQGDSSKLQDDERRTLDHLRRMVETGHIIALSHDQGEVLLRALDRYSDWEGTFRTFKHVRNILGLVGFFVVAWWASGGDPVAFLKGLLK